MNVVQAAGRLALQLIEWPIDPKSVGALTLLSNTLGLNDTSPDFQLALLVGHPAADAGMKI
jgi:hypothetical protein